MNFSNWQVFLYQAIFSYTGALNENTISSFSCLLDLVPGSGLGHLGLGTKALQEGRYKDAIKDLSQGKRNCNMNQCLSWCKKHLSFFSILS